MLSRLYASALTLPAVRPLSQSAPARLKWDQQSVEQRFRFLPSRYYSDVFDPWEMSEEPVVADLADDLRDIYLDLQMGLAALESSPWQEAAWIWRNSFCTHWGRHAVSALKVLHGLAMKEIWVAPAANVDEG